MTYVCDRTSSYDELEVSVTQTAEEQAVRAEEEPQALTGEPHVWMDGSVAYAIQQPR